MARASGSYPEGRWFDSTRRYHFLLRNLWEFSSAGRASALQAEGHRFEPYSAHHILCGLVVQLVRMPACHAGGRRFEPVPGRQLFNKKCVQSAISKIISHVCAGFFAYDAVRSEKDKHGGYRQAVKTQGCGSCIRGFESHYPPHYDVGVSPSGKATDSDSVTRRFESCYPSQSHTAFLILRGSCKLKMAT